jgi:hypothetical protein
MEKEKNVTPEGNAAASSAGAEVVEPKNLDGLLENNQKLRKEKENLKLKLTEVETQLKLKVENELVQKEEWKTLAEQRSKDLQDLKAKFDHKEKLINDSKKLNALQTELGKMGMDMKYFDVAVKAVDLNTITVDSETDVVMGVESAAKFLREKAAPLFSSQAPNVSHAAPQGAFQTLNYEDWKALPQDEKIKRERELLQNLGLKLKP